MYTFSSTFIKSDLNLCLTLYSMPRLFLNWKKQGIQLRYGAYNEAK